jgi:colanic acid biosynthesis glycosyl transferase WcaI
MICRWGLSALHLGRAPEVVIIGTDPILSVVVARIWKIFRPKTKIVHWCFDLYPEAAFADGIFRRNTVATRIVERVLRSAYAACDAIVDIGPCMAKLLTRYGSRAEQLTLVPWALEEPFEPVATAQAERKAIFGNASLALMYSGSFGRAHDCEGILQLARALRAENAHFAFSVRGNRENDLRAAITPEDTNVSFVPFATPENLQERLSAADIHVVSLRPEWTGTVVPSKFFGALAIGRPVLFFGARDSSIAEWIRRYGVGWVWESYNSAEIVKQMRVLACDTTRMRVMREHCFRIYKEKFSRAVILDKWNMRLRQLSGVEFAAEAAVLKSEASCGSLKKILHSSNRIFEKETNRSAV